MEALSREGFLSRLRQALRGMPQEEIDSAISYYEEYLDDAGAENEGQVLSQLGLRKRWQPRSVRIR